MLYLFYVVFFFQLHALQAEQALLIQKRSEAQEQLQEAQRARVCPKYMILHEKLNIKKIK